MVNDLPAIAFFRDAFRIDGLLWFLLVMAVVAACKYLCPRRNKVCRGVPWVVVAVYLLVPTWVTRDFFYDHASPRASKEDATRAWIRLDRSGFYCSSWRKTVPWSQITHLDFRGMRQYQATVWLSEQVLSEPGWTDFVRRRGRVNCELSSLDAPVSEIERGIRAHWQRYGTRTPAS